MNLATSISALCRAERGRSLSAWKTVDPYVRSCGGSLPAARKLWTKAARDKVTVHDVEVRRRGLRDRLVTRRRRCRGPEDLLARERTLPLVECDLLSDEGDDSTGFHWPGPTARSDLTSRTGSRRPTRAPDRAYARTITGPQVERLAKLLLAVPAEPPDAVTDTLPRLRAVGTRWTPIWTVANPASARGRIRPCIPVGVQRFVGRGGARAEQRVVQPALYVENLVQGRIHGVKAVADPAVQSIIAIVH